MFARYGRVPLTGERPLSLWQRERIQRSPRVSMVRRIGNRSVKERK